MNTEQKPNFYQRHKKGFKIIGVSVLCILGVGAAIYLNNNSDSENEEEPIFFTDNKDESNLIEVDFSIDLDDSPVQESVDTKVAIRSSEWMDRWMRKSLASLECTFKSSIVSVLLPFYSSR